MRVLLLQRIDQPASPPSAGRYTANSSRIALGLVCLILVAAVPLHADTRRPAHPNIVLIVADYMGYADIGPYGAIDIRTPALDALAKDGARFTSYYSASPVCGPSRAALLSGLYPARIGLEGNINPQRGGMPAGRNTLVRELKAAGYRTAMVGKWHLGQGESYSPLAHGFDRFFGFHSWTLGYHDHLTSSGEPGLYRGSALTEEDGYLTDLFTAEAIDFIEDSSSSPFFLYLAYNVALPPYQRPDLPPSQWSTGWDANQASRADYVAMVEAMDLGIGQVMARLSELGVERETLVVFTYDHGGRHLVRSDPLFHGFATLWEGGIRVPLLMKLPGFIPAGKRVDSPAIAMDLTATMLALAGRESAITELDGLNVLSSAERRFDEADRSLFWRFGQSQMKAVRRGRWKYVVDRNTQFLFDLDSDPGERQNRFMDHAAVANQLRDDLGRWEQSMATAR